MSLVTAAVTIATPAACKKNLVLRQHLLGQTPTQIAGFILILLCVHCPLHVCVRVCVLINVSTSVCVDVHPAVISYADLMKMCERYT